MNDQQSLKTNNSWLKTFLTDRPDWMKKYVGFNFRVVYGVVQSLNGVMKHLIEVQDLDATDPQQKRWSEMEAGFKQILGEEYHSGEKSSSRNDWSKAYASGRSMLTNNVVKSGPQQNNPLLADDMEVSTFHPFPEPSDEKDIKQYYDWKWAKQWKTEAQEKHPKNQDVFGTQISDPIETKTVIKANDAEINIKPEDGVKIVSEDKLAACVNKRDKELAYLLTDEGIKKKRAELLEKITTGGSDTSFNRSDGNSFTEPGSVEHILIPPHLAPTNKELIELKRILRLKDIEDEIRDVKIFGSNDLKCVAEDLRDQELLVEVEDLKKTLEKLGKIAKKLIKEMSDGSQKPEDELTSLFNGKTF